MEERRLKERNMEIVRIKSAQRATVVLTVPHLNLRRTWTRKGSVQQVPYNLLEQAIYERGVEYLFKSGILFIEDLETRIKLGLEDAEATEETAVLFELTDEAAEELLFKTPLKEMREKVDTMSLGQVQELTNVAIEKGLTDYQRCKILQEKTGKDVLNIVIRNNQEREADEAERRE